METRACDKMSTIYQFLVAWLELETNKSSYHKVKKRKCFIIKSLAEYIFAVNSPLVKVYSELGISGFLGFL